MTALCALGWNMFKKCAMHTANPNSWQLFRHFPIGKAESSALINGALSANAKLVNGRHVVPTQSGASAPNIGREGLRQQRNASCSLFQCHKRKISAHYSAIPYEYLICQDCATARTFKVFKPCLKVGPGTPAFIAKHCVGCHFGAMVTRKFVETRATAIYCFAGCWSGEERRYRGRASVIPVRAI